MTEKPKLKMPSFKQVAGGIGIVSLTGLISFLSTVFLTQKAFSSWCADTFYPRNNSQDISITKNEQRILNFDKSLIEIKANQKEMLKLLIRKK